MATEGSIDRTEVEYQVGDVVEITGRNSCFHGFRNGSLVTILEKVPSDVFETRGKFMYFGRGVDVLKSYSNGEFFFFHCDCKPNNYDVDV